MRDRKLPKKIIIVLIVLLVLGTIVYEIININGPTTRQANLSDYYQAETDKPTIVANGNITSVKAIIKNNKPYIKLDILMNEINSQFYFDESIGKLLFTDDSSVNVIEETDEFEGNNIYYINKDEDDKTFGQRTFVLLDYVRTKTNVDIEYFKSPDRIFIRSAYGIIKTANTNKMAAIREKAANSGRVLCQVSSGTNLWIISSDDGWSKVYVGDDYGHVGYINDEDIENIIQKAWQGPRPSETKHLTKDGKVCMVWQQVFTESGIDTLEKTLNRSRNITAMAPTWFSVTDEDGNIESRANNEYIKKAKNKGVEVWALVENFNKGENIDYTKLFGRQTSRKNMVDKLISEVVSHDIDGINVDFEGLPKEVGFGYVQFIRELGIECKKNEIVLSVDCYVPSAWTSHYHRRDISEVADYMIVMAYDEHYEGSDAGSTSSIQFIQNGVEAMINEGVPADRMIVGLPFYSRLWKGEGIKLSSTTISMDEMQSFIASHSYTWDETTGQYYSETKEGGQTVRLWVEDTKSFKTKLDMVDSFKVAGISGWKAGMDNSDVWKEINNYITNTR